MRRVLLAVLIAPLFVAPSAAQGPPLGTFVVGSDPAIAGVVAAGVEGWNATGAVAFVVAGGCGEGDVYFCLQATENQGAIAEWDFEDTSLIRVAPTMLHLFGPSSACHELGHFLGLHYHRGDGLSCLSSYSPGRPAAPDAVDLANLGVSQAPPAAPGQQNAPVVALPSTGSGSAAGRRVRWSHWRLP